MAAAAQVGCDMKLAIGICGLLLSVVPMRASVYYVTVAGLGGEPDYEQRFTASAKDLDKVFKADSTAHVFPLTGNHATTTQLKDTLNAVSRDAKPNDAFVLILIGNGSFDSAE